MVSRVHGHCREEKAYVLVCVTGRQCDESGWQLRTLLIWIGGHRGTEIAIWCQHREDLRWSLGLFQRLCDATKVLSK